MHKCSAHEHVAGKPAHLVSAAFTAIGYRWKLYTVHESLCEGVAVPETYSVVLQLRDSRMPLPCDLFVTRGPGADARIGAAKAAHTFAQRHRSTEPLVLAKGEAANALGEAETLVLRVGLTDRRAGRPSRGFLGQEGGGRLGGGSSSWGGPGDGAGSDDWSSDDGGALGVGDEDDDDSGSHSDSYDEEALAGALEEGRGRRGARGYYY